MIKYNGKDIIPRIDGKEISRVMYNGKQIYPVNNVIEIQLADVVAGDICAFDGTNKRFFRFVDSGATDNIKKYTPIGVVVIPTSHDVYGTGECGVMSLLNMDCDNPSQGASSNKNMCWGVHGDTSTLPNLNRAPIVGNGLNVGDASSKVTGENNYPYLPSDKLSAVQCPHDTDTCYYNSSTLYSQAPSPYLTDDSRNPGYYQTTSPSSSNNALADFDGRGNTDKIITRRGNKDYTSWKPTYNTASDYPAASCCDMFYTEGTQQGDWYLPACGELGYIMPPFNKINKAITNMRNIYSTSVGITLDTSGLYWSSSEYGSDSARNVNAITGQVGDGYKGGYIFVRAWLRIGAA